MLADVTPLSLGDSRGGGESRGGGGPSRREWALLRGRWLSGLCGGRVPRRGEGLGGSGQRWLVRQTWPPLSRHCWPRTLRSPGHREPAAGRAGAVGSGRRPELGVWSWRIQARGEPGLRTGSPPARLCALRPCGQLSTLPGLALRTDLETLLLRAAFQGQSPSFWSPRHWAEF